MKTKTINPHNFTLLDPFIAPGPSPVRVRPGPSPVTRRRDVTDARLPLLAMWRGRGALERRGRREPDALQRMHQSY
jgi:hypothetical protein